MTCSNLFRVGLAAGLALFLALPQAAIAGPGEVFLPYEYDRLVAAIPIDPVLGDQPRQVARLRFGGECARRTQLLENMQFQLNPRRQSQPPVGSKYTKDQWKVHFTEAQQVLGAELARPCKPNEKQQALADDLAKLPVLDGDAGELPASIATAIAAGKQRPDGLELGAEYERMKMEILKTLNGLNGCVMDGIQGELRTYRAVVAAMRQRALDARKAAPVGTLDPDRALDDYLHEKSSLDMLEERFRAFRVTCDKMQKEKELAALSKGHPCNDLAKRAELKECQGWELLLGRWKNVQYGGVIELRLEADGTMTGIVVTPGDRMVEYGFHPGMAILRGHRFFRSDSVWLASTKDGEYFAPAMPGRKPAEPYGKASWSPGSVQIATTSPTVLELPATIEGRMTNYTGWTRQ